MRIVAGFLLAAAIFFHGCAASSGDLPVYTAGYDLAHPDTTYILPPELHEVSGLAVTGPATVTCIQDENGLLFTYDLRLGKVTEQRRFYDDGDYEGIALRNDTFYILRSDGTLFEYKDTGEKPAIQQYATGIPAANNEGLCLDAAHNRLLIACKSKTGKGPELKNKRFIYAFDLETHRLNETPAFMFDVETITEQSKKLGVELPGKTRKNGKNTEGRIRLRTSAIAIHPLTRQLYLLSATDHMLFIFAHDGTLLHARLLDPVVFNKAEGISFFSNGDLLITNEGQDGEPTLIRINYHN